MEYINPAFFLQYWYDQLDYRFPLDDHQPVVRIPVAGPSPYNTLAVIRGFAPGPVDLATGRLNRFTFSVITPLILRGYDPLRPEQQHVQHSSTGFLRQMQIKEGGGPHIGDWNTEFTIALDNIHSESRVGPQGQVILTYDGASQIGNRLGAFQFQISSWILCWEPPDPLAAPDDADTLRKLERIGVDFSVPEEELREWMANPEFTPYPAISEALLLMQRGFKAPVFLDVIVFKYEQSPGVESPRVLADVRIDVLRSALLASFNERHGTNLSDAEDIFQLL